MSKINFFQLAQWATEEYVKCKWWRFLRKRVLLKIIYECYKDIKN